MINKDDYKGENIVFIVGAPRNGITWLQKLLSTHPQIKTGQESGLFDTNVGPQLKAWKRDMYPGSSGRPVGFPCYFTEKQFI